MKKFLNILISILLASPLTAEVIVDFDKPATFPSIEMYDSWEESPFRTGQLKGNWDIVTCFNPETETKEKVLGAQRSRLGSNLFGVKIDLAKPFELTPSNQFIKFQILRPTNGRVELIGLGSRKERLDQNPFTEQFCRESLNSVEVGKWTEVVFPVKGASGVEIRSLVIVPDCESPHNLDQDFLFYITDIELLPTLPKSL